MMDGFDSGTFTAPLPGGDAAGILPEEADTFWEGVLQILEELLPQLQPAFAEAFGICICLILASFLLSLVDVLPGKRKQMLELTGSVVMGVLLLRGSSSLIGLGVDTVRELSQYGNLLLPVMAAALAASGGGAVSAAQYAGTVFFDSVLSSLTTNLLPPMIGIYLCLALGVSALDEPMLEKLLDLMKWVAGWCLKLILYTFTGYMGITGIISGATDAAALKAAKLTISGMIPMVGSILADASEAVLVSADLVRNAAGIWGLLAILAICLGPFLRMGLQYLLLKCTSVLCTVFVGKKGARLIGHFSTAMGILLAMTGSCGLLLMISAVCFMRGVG